MYREVYMYVCNLTVKNSIECELFNGTVCILLAIYILAPWRVSAHNWDSINAFILMNK